MEASLLGSQQQLRDWHGDIFFSRKVFAAYEDLCGQLLHGLSIRQELPLQTICRPEVGPIHERRNH